MPSEVPVGSVIVPWTRMTYGPGRAMESRNCSVVVTVTVGPPAPPVVPFCPSALTAAKPLATLGIGGTVVVVVVVGGRVVVVVVTGGVVGGLVVVLVTGGVGPVPLSTSTSSKLAAALKVATPMPPAAYWLSVACSGCAAVDRAAQGGPADLQAERVPGAEGDGDRGGGERGGRAADELLELDGVVGAQGQVVVAGVGLGAGEHGDEPVGAVDRGRLDPGGDGVVGPARLAGPGPGVGAGAGLAQHPAPVGGHAPGAAGGGPAGGVAVLEVVTEQGGRLGAATERDQAGDGRRGHHRGERRPQGPGAARRRRGAIRGRLGKGVGHGTPASPPTCGRPASS